MRKIENSNLHRTHLKRSELDHQLSCSKRKHFGSSGWKYFINNHKCVIKARRIIRVDTESKVRWVIWDGISTKGVVPLVRINGIMKKKNYHTLLCRHAIPGGKKLLGRGFIFQQDNDPKHTAKLNAKYLGTKVSSGKLFFFLLFVSIWLDWLNLNCKYLRWNLLDGVASTEPRLKPNRTNMGPLGHAFVKKPTT